MICLSEKKHIYINSSRGSDDSSKSGIQTGHWKIAALWSFLLISISPALGQSPGITVVNDVL
jgi:hypothetical protein